MNCFPIKKVCLVQPSCEMPYDSSKSIWPPMGLLNLAASLRRRGYDVNIIDGLLEGWALDIPLERDLFLFGLPPRDIVRKILETDPDVVGLSVLFVNQWEIACSIARLLKREMPDVFLLWGGPGVTLRADKMSKIPELDGVILGEADLSGPDYLDALNKEGRQASIPPGTGIRQPEGFLFNKNYQPIRDLDVLPLPARDLVDIHHYMERVKEHKVLPKNHPVTTIQTSRGCPNHCIFCSSPVLYRRSYKVRSPESVVEEMEHLVDTYGVRELMILDENFGANIRRTERLIDLMLERSLDITWYPMAGMHVMTLTEPLLEKMVQAGLYKIKVSFESGNARVLKEVIKKPMDLAYGERIIRAAKSLGLAVGANFILGFPWETFEEIMDTYELAKRLDLDFTLWTLATPYPHTELTKRAIAEGLLPDDFDFDDLKPGRAYFDIPGATRLELETYWNRFWKELNFPTPDKEGRYYRYALTNPDYRAPERPKGELPKGSLDDISVTNFDRVGRFR